MKDSKNLLSKNPRRASHVSTHAELIQLFEKLQKDLLETRTAFPWTHRGAYLGWLAQTYEYARYSTRILALTGGRMPLDKTSFATRFIAHAAEEKGHERLLENDVRALGEELSGLEVLTEAKAFHQSLYYWFSGLGNPVGMFGWVLALEGFAVRNVPEMYETCLKAFGPKASSFLRVHAQEDEDHLQKAFSSIQSFTAEENRVVAEALVQYAELYGIILKRVQERAGDGGWSESDNPSKRSAA